MTWFESRPLRVLGHRCIHRSGWTSRDFTCVRAVDLDGGGVAPAAIDYPETNMIFADGGTFG
jgi:hypothetical protein